MKYIFVAGAPGSKWSSVVKNIYYSPDIDRSDYSDQRTYYHDASGKKDLMHLGAYFDPGMEFGDFFDQIENYSKKQCEKEFDKPFSGTGIKIIKSHVFAHKTEFLKTHWPNCPIILVHRTNDSCLGWWVRCGHFNITYPSYQKYYQDLRTMAKIIDHQNADIWQAILKYPGRCLRDNIELCNKLDIHNPPIQYQQDYVDNDIRVKVI